MLLLRKNRKTEKSVRRNNNRLKKKEEEGKGLLKWADIELSCSTCKCHVRELEWQQDNLQTPSFLSSDRWHSVGPKYIEGTKKKGGGGIGVKFKETGTPIRGKGELKFLIASSISFHFPSPLFSHFVSFSRHLMLGHGAPLTHCGYYASASDHTLEHHQNSHMESYRVILTQ